MQLVKISHNRVWRAGTRTAIVLSGAIPAASMLWLCFVIKPTLVSPSLPTAYAQIGDVAVRNILVIVGIVTVFMVGLVALAFWRLGQDSGWRWAGAYSVWRTLKWSMLVYFTAFFGYVLSAGLITIKIGKRVPGYYDDPALLNVGEWLYDPVAALAEPALLGAAIMFLVDGIVLWVKSITRKHRARRATTP